MLSSSKVNFDMSFEVSLLEVKSFLKITGMMQCFRKKNLIQNLSLFAGEILKFAVERA